MWVQIVDLGSVSRVPGSRSRFTCATWAALHMGVSSMAMIISQQCSPIRMAGGTHPLSFKLLCKRFVRLKKKDEKPNRFEFSVVQLSSLKISLLAQQLFLGLHMRVNKWGSYSSYRSATLRSWLCRKHSWCFGGVFFSAQPGCRQPSIFLKRIKHLLLPHCRRDETTITIVCIQ